MFLFKLYKFLMMWGFAALFGFLYFQTHGFWGFFKRPDDISNKQYFWRLWFRIGLAILLFMAIKMAFCYLMWGSDPMMYPRMGHWMMRKGIGHKGM